METNQELNQESLQPEEEVTIDQNKLKRYLEQLKLEQNLSNGIAAGLGAAILSAALWAVITVLTGYQIGYMALAVGFFVGYAVRYAGKGLDNSFGIAGGALALLGCVLGNFFSIVGFISEAEGLGYFDTLSRINFGMVPQLMTETFSVMDLLFYGIAVYEGYKFSFRQVSEADILKHASK